MNSQIGLRGCAGYAQAFVAARYRRDGVRAGVVQLHGRPFSWLTVSRWVRGGYLVPGRASDSGGTGNGRPSLRCPTPCWARTGRSPPPSWGADRAVSASPPAAVGQSRRSMSCHPVVARRQAVRFGTSTPKRRSMSCNCEVWSKTPTRQGRRGCTARSPTRNPVSQADGPTNALRPLTFDRCGASTYSPGVPAAGSAARRGRRSRHSRRS